MKNIWIINQYAAPPEWEVRVRNNMMAHHLIEKGYNVYIISASYIHNTEVNLIKDKAKYIKRCYDDLTFYHLKTSSYTGNGLSRIKSMFEFPLKLCRYFKEFDINPDVIICDLDAIFFPFANYVAKRKKCPIFLEIRDLWPASIGVYKNISDKNLLMRFLYMIEKKAYKNCDKLIFSMEGGYRYIKDKGWDNRISEKKVYYINNGIDLRTFNKNKHMYTYKDEIISNDKNFKVFYVGSIRTANGVKNIIDIAKETYKLDKEITFYIIGDGNEKEELIKYSEDLGLKNIIFKGYIEKKYIPSLLSNSNLNIVHFKNSPLKKYGASLNKLFEYLASGIPVLCDCEFYKDIINENDCGLSIDEDNPKILAQKIIDIKNMSKDKYNQLKLNCLKTSKKYDYSYLTDKMIKLIENED